MVDDSSNPQGRAETSAGPGPGGAPVAYCQECGRGLTFGSLQRVGNGVFCVGCASGRQPAQGWQRVPSGAVPSPGGPTVRGSESPSPGFAGVLGLIPGVGAMYNGQYAKGAMHLIVFVVLVTLADNLNWVFYWLVWGWVFYQAFDAYHTARARRDGQPLPNPFGWNDIGERLGFHRTPPPAAASFGGGGAVPGSPASARTATAWSGYVPAAEYGQASSVPPYPPPVTYPPTPPQESPRTATDNPYAVPFDAPVRPASQGPAPYTPPYMAGVPYTPTYLGAVPANPVVADPASLRSRRFPVGALWLIGLGVIFLLGNLLPGFHLDGQWLVPLILAVLALWGASRRWQQFRTASETLGSSPNLATAMTGPSVLLTVALLLTLDAGNLLPLHRSWPVLLVVWGSMLLLQRVAAPPLVVPRPEIAETTPPPPVRSTSGTGSLGL